MGNYTDLEPDFIERTINLIGQYSAMCESLDFSEQYNYTLTINCLLGLIVMPKERVITHVPNERLTKAYKEKIGLTKSVISKKSITLRDLIFNLRHAVAHFNINVISETPENLIDYIEFMDTETDEVIAKIRANELHSFLRFYSSCLLENLQRYRGN